MCGSFDEESSTYFIRDLGSFNGIFLNRVKIAPHTSYQLNVNSEIALGGGVRTHHQISNGITD